MLIARFFYCSEYFVVGATAARIIINQFDSICQKIDTERKGFVTMMHVLNSFQRLTPLCDKLEPDVAQIATLLLFGICINAISSYKRTIVDALISVVSSKVHSSVSFASFIEKERQRKEHSFIKDETASGGGGNSATKLVEEQLFVSDVLYELSKGLIEQASQLISDDHHPFSLKTPRKFSGKEYSE